MRERQREVKRKESELEQRRSTIGYTSRRVNEREGSMKAPHSHYGYESVKLKKKDSAKRQCAVQSG